MIEQLVDDPLPPDEAIQTIQPVPKEADEPEADDPDLETEDDEDLGDDEDEAEDPA